MGLLSQGLNSLSKSDVLFTAIGSDHGIEQENRAMKVLGSIKRTGSSYQKYFLTAAELGKIYVNISKINDDQRRETEEHYQLSLVLRMQELAKM